MPRQAAPTEDRLRPPPQAAALSLLERESQLESLAKHLREADTTAGKVVFVAGDAGSGKSALVEQFAQQAAETACVFWGHADAFSTSRVLGPVNEVLAGMRLLSDAPLGPGHSREWLFFRLFEKLSPPNPASVMILEDLQWADEATLDFVRFLGRRIQRTRCLLVATYRDEELTLTHLLRSVLGDLTGRHIARIFVPALTFGAVKQLAQGTHWTAEKAFQITSGNAFFVRELVASPSGALPHTVCDAVLARLMHCSQAARKLATLVSLLPGRTELWLISNLLGDIGATADEAVARGLLRIDEETVSFRYELGRVAVESTIPCALAQKLHQDILRELIAHDADLSRLVHHASLANDEKAMIEFAPKAAQRAAFAGAHREAAAHLAIALRCADSLSLPQRARLLELHAIECDITNQVSTSLDSGCKALEIWRQLGDSSAQARVMLSTSRPFWKAGQKAVAERNVAEAVALLESLPPTQDLAMAYSVRSQLAMTSDRNVEALEFGMRALDCASRFDDKSVRAHALNNCGAAMLATGNEAGLTKLELSLSIAVDHALHEHAGRAYANLVSGSVRQRLAAPARRYISEGMEYCEVHEIQDCLSYIRAYSAHFDLDQGNWNAAVLAAEELIEHHHLATAQRIPAMVVLATVRARRGDPSADCLLDEAMRLALLTGELQRIGPVAAIRAEVACYRGDLQRVAAEASAGLQATSGHREPWIVGVLAYWAHRADPTFKIASDIAEPYGLMIEGNWAAAAAAWHKLGAPFERALALAEGSRDALSESLAILEQLSAQPLITMVRQRLRSLGVRAFRRGPNSATLRNPAGLTSREAQVLPLLVQGHTNGRIARRLHISVKTVDHHVSAILEKLNVRSRAEAVAAAFTLGIANPGHSASKSATS